MQIICVFLSQEIISLKNTERWLISYNNTRREAQMNVETIPQHQELNETL